MRFIPSGRYRLNAVLLFHLLLAACVTEEPAHVDDGAALDDLPRRPDYIVDSIRPMAEELRRFRETVMKPESLSGGAATREALVARFMASLARQDSASLAGMHLDRGEFAYYYFAESKFAAPPYELAPGLVWRQMAAESNKGIRAALRLLGSENIEYRGHHCGKPVETVGGRRLWGGCRVAWRVKTSGDSAAASLFGSILEHRGRFKFVSYANEM